MSSMLANFIELFVRHSVTLGHYLLYPYFQGHEITCNHILCLLIIYDEKLCVLVFLNFSCLFSMW